MEMVGVPCKHSGHSSMNYYIITHARALKTLDPWMVSIAVCYSITVQKYVVCLCRLCRAFFTICRARTAKPNFHVVTFGWLPKLGLGYFVPAVLVFTFLGNRVTFFSLDRASQLIFFGCMCACDIWITTAGLQVIAHLAAGTDIYSTAAYIYQGLKLKIRIFSHIVVPDR